MAVYERMIRCSCGNKFMFTEKSQRCPMCRKGHIDVTRELSSYYPTQPLPLKTQVIRNGKR